MTTGGDKYTCRFLIGATGYYSYENPHIPHFPGQEDFKGTLVHPQFWKAHHDTEIVGKKVSENSQRRMQKKAISNAISLDNFNEICVKLLTNLI